MATIVVRVIGDEELARKLRSNFAAAPVRRFLTRSAIVVQGHAREKAPVDTGQLRNSIAYEIDGATMPRWARIGTNVKHGPFVELGTRPHFPPPNALEPWARRHGFGPSGGFLVARAISRHGTKARPYLVPGLNASQGQIRALVSTLGAEIEAAAGAA